MIPLICYSRIGKTGEIIRTAFASGGGILIRNRREELSERMAVFLLYCRLWVWISQNSPEKQKQ